MTWTHSTTPSIQKAMDNTAPKPLLKDLVGIPRRTYKGHALVQLGRTDGPAVHGRQALKQSAIRVKAGP